MMGQQHFSKTKRGHQFNPVMAPLVKPKADKSVGIFCKNSVILQ